MNGADAPGLHDGGVSTLPATLARVLEDFREGKVAALARAISVVEGERAGFQSLLHLLLADGPRARRVGFTGPPGAGKSTLVAAAALSYRSRDERVGIVAVDPTSPYSGGALLGDRIRMNDLAVDPGIFIRSMATRGSLGGLAVTTKEVVDLMDVFGFERVLVETVGVGQTELEITAAADTVVVILTPESGDAIQAMKAGLMEIADVFVVNKADRPGAAGLLKEIRQALHLRAGDALSDVPAHHGVDLSPIRPRAPAPESAREESTSWDIPVIATVAQSGQGVDELLDAVDRHGRWLREGGALTERRRARARRRIHEVVERALRRVAWTSETVAPLLESGLDRIQEGSATPYSVSADILRELLPSGF